MEYNRQTSLAVYGDGPFDPEMGHPTGCQDVAVLTLLPGFAVVRTEYLDRLEKAIKSAVTTLEMGDEYGPDWQKALATLNEALEPQ